MAENRLKKEFEGFDSIDPRATRKSKDLPEDKKRNVQDENQPHLLTHVTHKPLVSKQ
jgi:hypothetical protein